MNRRQRRIIRAAFLAALLLRPGLLVWAQAQEEGEGEKEETDQSEVMIAVSADIVEISGSISRDVGFSWTPFTTGINFAEKGPIPGLIDIADFERLTQLQTSLKMLETEGKAQLLSNPKLITKNATQANFVVG